MGTLAELILANDHCLVAARHGQTEWNLEDRITTRTDIPLTEHGENEAHCIRVALAGVRFDRALSSPKKRARLTGEIALADAEPVALAFDERLVEIDAGVAEGLTFPQLRDLHADYLRDDDPIMPAGAESPATAAVRAREILDEAQASGGRTFVSSHGGFLRVLACAVSGAPPESFRRWRLQNAHLVVVVFHPTPPAQLAGFNLPPR